MKLIDAFLNALYPEGVTCLLCNKNAVLDDMGLCAFCREKTEPAGNVSIAGGISGAVAGIAYNETAAQLIHGFKYHNKRYIGSGLAGGIALPKGWSIDAIVPVPLHPKRERERGYNQSLILAEKLGKRYRMPVRPGYLKRVRYTEMQSLTAGRDRRENVRAAFKARGCSGKSILLVDDVITTGSTMEECAAALRAAGAADIYCAAAAYAGGRHDRENI